MARIFMDGFERGETLLQGSLNNANNPVVVNNGVFVSSGYLFLDGAGSSYCYKNFLNNELNNGSYGHLRFNFHNTDAKFSVNFYNIEYDTTISYIRIYGSSVNFYRNNVLIYTLNLTRSLNVPGASHLLEWFYKDGKNFTGTLIIKIDGITIMNYTNVTTTVSDFRPNRIYLTCEGQTKFDDFIIDDTNWIGSSVILPLTPNASGDITNFSVTGSTYNYQSVSGIPDNYNITLDNNYVYTNQINKIDLYNTSEITQFYRPKTVQLITKAGVLGNCPVSGLSFVLKNNSVTAESANVFTLPKDIYYSYDNIFETNPCNGNTSWTSNDISNLQIGIKTR